MRWGGSIEAFLHLPTAERLLMRRAQALGNKETNGCQSCGLDAADMMEASFARADKGPH